ncbi:ATP-binding protein [Streptomyces melanogenes]|uniref:ATP-binding protein n=1 Tax=Streptomyces melanogenes TaxID=67326 RepID=UPI0037BAB4A2
MNITVGDHSARHLRRILRWYLVNWSMTAVADAAELALTELTANVVRHVPGRHCHVLILARPSGVRVELTDDCAKLPQAPARIDELAESGRGLMIVAAVTDRWGVLSHAWGGKTVWFECDVRRGGGGGG